MITLITIFYTFLFPMNEPEALSCKQKLKKINYTFQYDREPVMCKNAYYRYGGCYCKDGGYGYDSVETKAIKQIYSYYKCFKNAVKSNDNKVLLITHKLDELTSGELLNTTVECYGLDADKLYFAYNPLQPDFVKVELLEKDNTKLQAKNIVPKEEVEKALKLCTVCSLYF